ncbi:uncharacterized protein LOC135695815 [Rhopilema esculentum]|uniref:uncharacterized protein LOC135695815 n=1 Tax=Rhopilema esculentum TaxID=499914 RepID=UPI0031CE1F6B
MAAAVYFAVVIFILSNIRKESFASANSVCFSFYGEEAKDVQNSRICASVWVHKQEKGIHVLHNTRTHVGLQLLLLLAGDVEMCPGPCQKCITCKRPMRKNQSSDKCFACGQKLHLKCLVDQIENGCERVYCRSCLADKQVNPDIQMTENIYNDITTFLQSRGLKLFHQNINGLAKKIEDLKLLLQETKHNIDFFGVTETHLHKDIRDEESKIEGYEFLRNDRKNGSGGGVGCFIRNDLGWQRREDLENDSLEAIWVEIFVKNSRPLLVCVIYRPPDTSKYLDRNFESEFSDMINTSISENKELILMGDLNADYLNTSKNKEVKRIIKGHGLKQIITKPTRVTKTQAHS